MHQIEEEQSNLQAREKAYQEFVEAYQEYCQNRQKQKRYQQKIQEEEDRKKGYQKEREKLNSQIEKIRTLKEGSRRKNTEYQKEILRFERYQRDWEEKRIEEKTEKKMLEETEIEIDYEAIKARYLAITEGISKNVERLTQDLEQETIRYEKKQKELKRESRKYKFLETDYKDRVFSEEEEERLEKELRYFSKEENTKWQTQISTLAVQIQHLIEKMQEKTGYQEVMARKQIEVPSWKANRELYQIQMRDFVREWIQLGLIAIEKNENIEEFLGKMITTKWLYEEVVGMGNIGIRLL